MRPGRRLLAVATLASFSTTWFGCGGGGADITAPPVGTLEITTITTGPEPDPDGYFVSLDGAEPIAIGPNADLSLTDLLAGAHTVELSGLAGNCTVSGGSRIEVSVTVADVTTANYAVTCAPTTGTIQVSTTSTGDPADANGYRLLLDGVDTQPIAGQATLAIASVSPGSHWVGLGDLAGNCAVTGDNPRPLTVAAGATAAVAFEIVCQAAPPTSGALELTTSTSGPSPDSDGYQFRIDNGAAQTIGVNASATVSGLTPGPHTVELIGVAGNCAVGQNPHGFNVPAGGSVQVAFVVTCNATAGGLTVTIAGLPSGTVAAVTVTGPGGFSTELTATQTLTGLTPGNYTVAASEVSSGNTRYPPSPASQSVSVAAGATASATVTYGPAAGPTLNLRIDSWQLTQSVQTPRNDIPMVANRDGYLRVFVVSNQTTTAAPSVRVRLFRNGSLTSTLTIPAPDPSTPTSKTESRLTSSWNVKIPPSAFGPGFSLLADVDPGNAIPETDESDNVFPASGVPQTFQVQTLPTLAVRFVPVKQEANGLLGDVSDANRSRFLDMIRRMYPVATADGDLHAVYTTTTTNPLQPGDANGAWVTILGEVEALRVVEGTNRNYYGVVRRGYSSGIAGLGYVGLPSAIGFDDEFDRSRVMAHEIGHNFGRLHTPCGNPPGVDPDYPYPAGNIGVFGMDMQHEELRDPNSPDIMGYCANPWVSDYTYRAILASRIGTGRIVALSSGLAQRCLLVWGRIVNGAPVLEPAFEIVTRPSLPKARGQYSVEGRAADGSPLFSLSFDAALVADDPRGTRQFAFAVPLGNAPAIGGLRLTAPGGAAELAPAVRAAPAAPADLQAHRVAGGLALRWNPAAHPMVMVRDPQTGEVLSFARGGQVEISTTRSDVEVVASDGVGSWNQRVVVKP
jgi:CARDB